MEHQLLPHEAIIDVHERAPFVAEVYDGGRFLDYPRRSRFKPLYNILRGPEDDETGPKGVIFDEMEKQESVAQSLSPVKKRAQIFNAVNY